MSWRRMPLVVAVTALAASTLIPATPAAADDVTPMIYASNALGRGKQVWLDVIGPSSSQYTLTTDTGHFPDGTQREDVSMDPTRTMRTSSWTA